MENKLSYLGFLGLLGFGGFFGTPLMFSFFGNFIFFRYIRVVPDELFWINVRISATRGFFIFLILSNIIIITTLVLAANENLHSHASSFALGGFSLMLSVGTVVFIASLVYLEAKEQQGKDNETDNKNEDKRIPRKARHETR